MIRIGPEICSDHERSSEREWLETNGIGGYASGTISGTNTRRYHGLLVAATTPPLGRMVLLSKFEETLVVDGERFELSSNRYPGIIHPQGHQFISEFRLDPFPVWTFNVGGVEIEKKLFMPRGENSTVISWSLVKQARNDHRQFALELRPLIAFRDHHHLRHDAAELIVEPIIEDGSITFSPLAGAPALNLANNAVAAERTGYWYRNFEYAIEQERGFDFTEDLYQPCELRFDLSQPAVVIASTEAREIADARSLENAEVDRRSALVESSDVGTEFGRQLVLAADQFIVDRGDGKTVIAGYHWFSDWGRDTMIALPGLTLATNRTSVAKSILLEFSKHISEGMLPNRFPDAGDEPEYNTVDATLWYFEAIRAYVEKTGDHAFVRRNLYDKLVDIIDWHVRGTRYNIHVDADGLLYAGEPDVQLTWMDAKIGDWVVTPRTGKPVEIQALWYNALCTIADLAAKYEEAVHEKRFREMAAVARESFNAQFWNMDAGCLFDVVEAEYKDASIRPNQIFAVSLHHSILGGDHARKVVDKVESELLTPVGLRSLSPSDPRYVPIYIGSPHDRDAAYHQGTVWAWLIGPFIDAYRKTHEPGKQVDKKIEGFLSGFEDHLSTGMIGQVAEIFDADPPHAPRGCAAQAWSVAEVLRGSRPIA
jgi:predicted glycogen debranching enzyme